MQSHIVRWDDLQSQGQARKRAAAVLFFPIRRCDKLERCVCSKYATMVWGWFCKRLCSPACSKNEEFRAISDVHQCFASETGPWYRYTVRTWQSFTMDQCLSVNYFPVFAEDEVVGALNLWSKECQRAGKICEDQVMSGQACMAAGSYTWKKHVKRQRASGRKRSGPKPSNDRNPALHLSSNMAEAVTLGLLAVFYFK